ncbi:hypothetical protein [Mycobacterium sp. 852014-52144_SCH5372336]|uniref:hypothetical protein n=1 Tax=Mycobacterium sp. 852014-52144_SCH5372336 TaxID=1834115 RepID=UPI000AB5E64B|nr:hypothetical protein [Mycobacterium sp. 852014-52144_SCH5372336]
MNTIYNDARVSESICIDNDTEVIVVRRSYPSGSADVAITFAYACPESGAATSLTVELSPKNAHWLAHNLVRATYDPPRRDPDPDDPPF